MQKFDTKERKLTISIDGQFNFDIHTEFRDAYRDIKPDSKLQVIVDLRNTDYMDSAALGMLLLLEEHFAGQQINLINCPTYIKQVLGVANFNQKFTIE